MQGYSGTAAVLLVPMFFGVAHLHHVHELTVHQQKPLSLALLVVCATYSALRGLPAYAPPGTATDAHPCRSSNLVLA